MIKELFSILADLRAHALASFTFIGLRIIGCDVRFAWVRLGRYPREGDARLNLDRVQGLDLLLDEARRQFESEQRRRAVIQEKFKTLLQLSGFVLSAIALFVGAGVEECTQAVATAALLSVAMLLASIVILLASDDVAVEHVVSIDDGEATLGDSDLRKSLVNSYLSAASSTGLRTDYLVDLYRLARTLALAGCFMVCVVLICAILG